MRELWNIAQHWKLSVGSNLCDWTSLKALLDDIVPPESIFTSNVVSTVAAKLPISGEESDDDISSASESGKSQLSEQEEEELMELVEEAILRDSSLTLVEPEEVNKPQEPGEISEMESEAESEANDEATAVQQVDYGVGPLLMGLIPNPSILWATRMKAGITCGRYGIEKPPLVRFLHGDKWFDGTILTVVAEALVQACGDGSMASHIIPKVLQSIRRMLDSPGDEGAQAGETKYVLVHALEQLSADTGLVVLPVHVPAHWTLVCLDLGRRTIREVFHLLDIVRDARGGTGWLREDWVWETEERQRPTRQFNSYDCGVFTLADMAEYLTVGRSSYFTQEMMPSWRAAIWELLEDLRNVRVVKPPRAESNDDERLCIVRVVKPPRAESNDDERLCISD
ncbi:hypothetical protein M422DRAFT_50826 [Sphaerobolus stellatus SS14]|uniref:Ubiquitin-like protease family profile domain-containing protein n=1 Tax=Sphaerobolus stellatus (strain SS14) TaxID=990650 RepID=A0A0C9VH05_SPHS4|nr:hypothetical protein M422DRAFT_50826 [Sphaerobolus stellatus SS14]